MGGQLKWELKQGGRPKLGAKPVKGEAEAGRETS